MYSIKKRNGEAEVFELGKIKSAIARTFESCNRNYQDSIVEIIALKAVSAAETKVADGLLSVEDIQDAVEKTLMTLGYEDVAKAYILYRKQHEKARNAQNTLLNYKNVVESYTKKLDWRVKENATVTYSVGGLILGNSGAVTANYWLSEIYDEEIANAHRNCDLHIHDLSMLSPYCGGWSLKQLIKEGLGGIEGKITSTPASHLSTLCNQMVNFLGCTQNEYAGAQAFSSVDTYLAPFVKVDNLTYKEVKQCIQSLVFGLNTPSRWGCVTTDTEVLTVNGFKEYNELKEGDLVYTYKDGSLEINPVNHIVVKPFSGKLHSYQSRNYAQTVTPEHRVLVCKHNSNECIIKHSEEIFTVKTPFALPVTFASSELTDNGLSDEEVMLAAMVYTDGSFDFRGDTIHKVSIYKSPNRYGSKELVDILTKLNLDYTASRGHGNFGEVNKYVLYGDSARFICDLCGNKKEISSKFMNMSKRQAELFLKTWASFDGDEEKMLCQYDNDTIRDNLQQIAILAGKCSYWHTAKLYSGKTTNYVKIRKVDSIYPTDRVEVDYSGDVWCPSVENGTVVFRDNSGCVFISGNCQAPFTNFTMDWTVPDDLAELNCIVGGKELDFCYKDCKREMDMIHKAIIDVMLEGDANGRGFQYPVLTYSITKDFDWDEESINNQMLFEMTAKYGIPYFSNYINSDMSPSDLRAMCCRLRLDLRELRKKSGGYFGSGDSTGSIGVVTINMPRLAYTSKDEAEFYTKLDKLMDIAARSLEIKRSVISQFLDNGLYPYTKRYLGSFNNYFSTIGLVGMNEACLNAAWIKDTIASEAGYKFSCAVLDHMRERLADYQEKYGNLYNLEATPAESTSHRFAKHDVEAYPDIITAGTKTGGTPYYTNSSHLPVDFTEDIFTALDIQDGLQTKYTSGTVFHAFLGEKLPSWQSAMKLTRTIAENYRLPYFTFSPTYSVCKNHGYIAGEHFTCPECGEATEVYSRVTGYYRAVQNFNDGKAQEYKDRTEYVINSIPEKFNTEDTHDESPYPTASVKKITLFATTTCPNCAQAKKQLTAAGIDYDVVIADGTDPVGTQLAIDCGVKQAPTLVLPTGEVISNVSNIIRYIRENK